MPTTIACPTCGRCRDCGGTGVIELDTPGDDDFPDDFPDDIDEDIADDVDEDGVPGEEDCGPATGT